MHFELRQNFERKKSMVSPYNFEEAIWNNFGTNNGKKETKLRTARKYTTYSIYYQDITKPFVCSI